MTLSQQFQPLAASGAALPQKPRPAPFSIRLSAEERARIATEAAGAPLGGYIKSKIFGTMPLVRERRKVLTIKDREALARALALLGRSHFSNNLNQLAKAVNIGTLPVTPETEAELLEALSAVQDIQVSATISTRGSWKSPRGQPCAVLSVRPLMMRPATLFRLIPMYAAAG